jgi:hypothetical protein
VPTGRKARWSRESRSRWVLALALGALGVLAPPDVRSSLAAEQPPTAQSGKVPLIYQKRRAFRIPFHIGAQAQARIKEVQLWVSEDAGFHWEPRSRTTPDLGKFTFRTSHDGEFWFATRTVTVDDEFSPSMSQTVEPSMKVVVDSVPPSLVLEPDGRRGSTAAIRWEVKDEHLDLKTLVLEYQAEGAHEWRKVPIRRRSLLGAESWDAGTADSLRVRATVADKAGNVTDAEIVLPEGTAETPDLAAVDPESTAAPPVEQISSGNSLNGGSGSLIAGGSSFPPIQESPPSTPGAGSRSGARRTLTRRPKSDEASSNGAFPGAPGWDRGSTGRAGEGARKNSPVVGSPSGPPTFSDPFAEGAALEIGPDEEGIRSGLVSASSMEPEQRLDMARAARVLVAGQYSSQTVAAEMMALYREALKL